MVKKIKISFNNEGWFLSIIVCSLLSVCQTYRDRKHTDKNLNTSELNQESKILFNTILRHNDRWKDIPCFL